MKGKALAVVVFISILAGLLPCSRSYGDIFIVSNSSVSNTTLTKAEVKAIFLGKQRRWDDNQEIELVLLKNPKVYNAFVRKYTNRTSSQFRNWWRERLFTGQGRMPQSFKSEKKMIEYIAKTDGAIGFMASKLPTDSYLKVIQVTD